MQRSTVLLKTNKEKSKTEIKKTILFTTASKEYKNKTLRINLIEEMRDLTH